MRYMLFLCNKIFFDRHADMEYKSAKGSFGVKISKKLSNTRIHSKSIKSQSSKFVLVFILTF